MVTICSVKLLRCVLSVVLAFLRLKRIYYNYVSSEQSCQAVGGRLPRYTPAPLLPLGAEAPRAAEPTAT